MGIFQDKICIVTGAGSGIGKALCEQLSAQGAVVTATDIDASSLQQAVQAISRAGGRCTAAVFDVSDYEAFKQCIEETAAQHGRLDYMFNNAGIACCAEIHETQIEHWRKVLDVNLNGVIHGSLTAFKIMARQRFGHIVNLSSVEGFIPFPLTASYVASKFAVLGLSQSMWVEGRDLGVRVSAVCPGFIKTSIFDVTPMIGIERRKWREANAKWEKFGVSPEKCAAVMLKGVAKNKAIIPVTLLARVFWYLYRLWPTLLLYIVLNDFRGWRKTVRESVREQEAPI